MDSDSRELCYNNAISGQNIFRLKLDLGKIFSDHRKKAVIIVKKEYKKIKHLKQHISHMFGIKHFILTINSEHFLPDLEDIGILCPNEEICVIPVSENTEPQEDHSTQNGFESPIKQSSKKRNLPLEEDLLANSPRAKKLKKRLRTKHSPVIGGNALPDIAEGVDNKIKNTSTSEQESVKLSTSAHPDIKYVGSTKSNFQSCDASVRLSRPDTPNVKQYIPPKQMTDKYLSKNKVNIVKIDVINPGKSEKLPDSNFSSTQDRVKKVVEYFEKVTSPDSHRELDTTPKDEENNVLGQTEASNYTKIYLSQKDANSNFASQPESDAENVEIKSSVTDLSSTSDKKKDVASPCKYKEQENIEATPVCLRQSTEVPREDSSIVEGSTNQLEAETPVKHSSKNVGVGHLLDQLKESDSQNDIATSENTKRKRVRKRRRVNHNKSNSNDVGSETNSSQNSYQFHNPLTSVPNTSNSHVRFEDHGSSSLKQEPTLVSHSNSINEVFTGGTITSSTPFINAAIITGDNNEKTIMENKSFFSLDMIQKSPLFTEKMVPKNGDFVAFKILTLSDNITPQPSDYIVGEVLEYLAPRKIVRFKIARGIEELCKDELFLDEPNTNSQSSDVREVHWARVLEARLLYP